MEVLTMRKVKISMLILVVAILLSTWLVLRAYHASKQDNGLEEKRILRLKYDLLCTLVEYEPGKEVEFRKNLMQPLMWNSLALGTSTS